MSGADVVPQGGNESGDGIVAAPQGAENGHKHRRTDLALAWVDGRGNLRMAQKREEFIPVFLQPVGQAARISIGVGCLCN